MGEKEKRIIKKEQNGKTNKDGRKREGRIKKEKSAVTSSDYIFYNKQKQSWILDERGRVESGREVSYSTEEKVIMKKQTVVMSQMKISQPSTEPQSTFKTINCLGSLENCTSVKVTKKLPREFHSL